MTRLPMQEMYSNKLRSNTYYAYDFPFIIVQDFFTDGYQNCANKLVSCLADPHCCLWWQELSVTFPTIVNVHFHEWSWHLYASYVWYQVSHFKRYYRHIQFMQVDKRGIQASVQEPRVSDFQTGLDVFYLKRNHVWTCSVLGDYICEMKRLESGQQGIKTCIIFAVL